MISKNNIKKNKKSQFFVISGMLLFIILIFIYSLETENSYITEFSKNSILNNVIYETCQIGYNSNGSQIDSRFQTFGVDVFNYCDLYGNICDLTIINNTQIPPEGNWSKLNYTHYNYNIVYSWYELNTTLNFSCS